jgi:replicative DNA helicase
MHHILDEYHDYSIPTGFSVLNRQLDEFRSSGLYVISGDTRIGKTTFILSLINKILSQETPIGLVSLEMTKTQLLTKLIAINTEIPFSKLSREDNFEINEDEKITNAHSRFNNDHLQIHTPYKRTIADIYTLIKQLKKENKIRILFIDDIHKIQIDSKSRIYAINREQEIGFIARELKRIALEFNIPIIAISQQNRNPNNVMEMIYPKLSDLRDSGSIENEADAVIFIVRQCVYGLLQDNEGNNTQSIAELKILKNKFGPTDTIKINFYDHIPKFSEIEYNYSDQNQSFPNIEKDTAPQSYTIKSKTPF